MNYEHAMRGCGLALALALFSISSLAQVGNNPGLANPNLAERDEILALPHMTESLADALIAGRPYLDGDALHAVLASALAGQQLAELYGSLFLPLNLNTASRETIMRVPAMSRKMAHEFEEYRPYASLEQFRQEIGKYVDDAELARLEQYVFVPMSLNEAPAEHLETIPGMSRKMVHEFEEYRPYSNIEQFRQEIGKYVDENEVARLERYVTLD